MHQFTNKAIPIVARYSAMYHDSKTGRVCMEIKRADNYLDALNKLPRWTYANGIKMKRQGGPQIFRDYTL